MKSYFAWWFKCRVQGKFWFHPFSASWWKDAVWYNIKNFFFFIVYKYPRWAQWSIPGHLSDTFLKATAWMLPDGLHSYPGVENVLEDGIPDFVDGMPVEYDEERNNKAFAKWKEIIHKMRFAHFYMQFIQEDEFGWMINNVQEREYARRWALKKYAHVKEFLTEEYFNSMYTDESLKYASKMDMDKEVEGGGHQIIFIDTNKETGEVVKDLPFETKYPHYKMAKEMEPQFKEGMDLWRKWYQSLWD